MKSVVLVSEVIDLSCNLVVEGVDAELWNKCIFKKANYCDLIALEIITRLEKDSDNYIETVTVGQDKAIQLIKSHIAPKVNKSTLIVEQDIAKCDSYYVSNIIGSYLTKSCIDIILCGDKTSDYGGGITGSLLASNLGYNYIGNIIDIISLDNKNKTICVKRKMDWGKREILVVPLPIVLGIDEGEITPSMPTFEQKLDVTVELIDANTLASHIKKKQKNFNVGVHILKPRGVFSPDETLSPAERIKALMSGGLNKKRSDIWEGGEESLSDQLVDYLKEIQVL